MRALSVLRQAASALAAVAMHLALVLLFFGVLTPLAVLLRVLRVDVMGTRRDAGAESYWRGRRPPHDA